MTAFLRLRSVALLAALALLPLSACVEVRLDDPAVTSEPAPPTSGPPSDSSLPGTGTEPTPTSSSSSSGGTTTGTPATEPPCTFQQDCEAGTVCFEERCVAVPECRNIREWNFCVFELNELAPGFGDYAVCRERFCAIPCLTDQECREGYSCTDFGKCVPFEGELAAYPPTSGERAPLRAGLGEALLQFPIGMPLGGYGSRGGTRRGAGDRYAESLTPSYGKMHGLYARALALDNGDRQLMLLRLPVIYIGADIHEAVARILQRETGIDWRDSLIINATHTHSGPARLWPLPEDTGLPIGALGIGEYSEASRDWLIDSLAEAALQALDSWQDAQLGWEIIEAFDTDDQLARDRWSETPPFDDNRLLLIRVDDADGVPLTAVVSFGVHGTVNSEDYAVGDVLVGIERTFEERLGRQFSRFVPVLFVNQNSGSMSPANNGQPFPQAFERAGAVFADAFLDAFLDIETDTDIELASRTYRFPITYELLGYEPGEWTSGNNIPFGGEMLLGALQCGDNSYRADDDFENVINTNRLNCLSARFIFRNRPFTNFMTSQITAVQLAGLSMITSPGELTMSMSWKILKALRDTFGVDPMSAWTMGYAQDHHLYISPTTLRGERPPFPGLSLPDGLAIDDYPTFAFTWLRGGYTQTQTGWGWKFGDYIAERSVDAWRLLVEPDAEPGVPWALPRVLSPSGQPPFGIDASNPERVGTIVQDVPPTVSRFEPIEFAWVGGDPGAEMPQAPLVELLREEEGTFEPVFLPNYRAYTNREYRFMTRVRAVGEEYQWVARWEELKDFPAGTYRFRVTGHWTPVADDYDARTPYTLDSSPFELVPLDDLRFEEVSTSGATFEARVGYPPAERVQIESVIDGPMRDHGALTGHFRMRHPDILPGMLVPLLPDEDIVLEGTESGVSLTLTRGPDEVRDPEATVVIDVTGARPRSDLSITITDATLLPGAWNAELTLTDLWGNTGTTTFSVTIPGP